MAEICVFAGTTEGRRLLAFLKDQPVRVYACVATEYGEALVPHGENIEISARRLDQEEMRALFEARRFDVAVDATHPHAVQVSEFIAAACAQAGVEYLRLNREEIRPDDEAVYVDSIQGAADYLSAHPGTALLATGSKELAPYARVEGFQDRFYVRVLPMASSLTACEAAGFAPSHIIAMQGPFSVELNAAMLRAVGADYLVTKDSGASGGFQDKLEAARRVGARCVVIGRPAQKPGLDYARMTALLCRRYGLKNSRHVAVVGIGMGARATMTFEADAALRGCECVIGAPRMLEAVAHCAKPAFPAIAADKIRACMDEHPEYRRFAVVMSGDSGFFSGTKKLLPLLDGDEIQVICGVSSLQYLCARLHTGWDDVCILSLHGRRGSAAAALRMHGKLFVLLDGADGVSRLCAELCRAGMGDSRVSVGERLSYPDEHIETDCARALVGRRFSPLSVALVERQGLPAGLPIGLPDGAFQRQMGEKIVPMTKREVRTVSIARLGLWEDAVVYDVGAGTGSVSVEAALLCPKGRVYAVECRGEAAELIRRNGEGFGLANLEVVEGMAPEALTPLPPPTHAFIGGSSGNLRDIIAVLLEKNAGVRIVANAIALETVGEILRCAGEFGFDEVDLIQLSAAQGRPVGRYHMMSGQNPVWIATMQRNSQEITDMKQDLLGGGNRVEG